MILKINKCYFFINFLCINLFIQLFKRIRESSSICKVSAINIYNMSFFYPTQHFVLNCHWSTFVSATLLVTADVAIKIHIITQPLNPMGNLRCPIAFKIRSNFGYQLLRSDRISIEIRLRSGWTPTPARSRRNSCPIAVRVRTNHGCDIAAVGDRDWAGFQRRSNWNLIAIRLDSDSHRITTKFQSDCS